MTAGDDTLEDAEKTPHMESSVNKSKVGAAGRGSELAGDEILNDFEDDAAVRDEGEATVVSLEVRERLGFVPLGDDRFCDGDSVGDEGKSPNGFE